MSKTLSEWVETEVRPHRDASMDWLSREFFFRDPSRALYSDPSCFFAPADGIILYQTTVAPDKPLVEIKGRMYSLRDAMRDPTYDRESLVIGIFMTFYDVHVNRIPYAGRLTYRSVDPIDTFNHPMLEVEKDILDDLRVDTDHAGYLQQNQRMVNRVDVASLRQSYYMVQIADYDVDCITPFDLKQGQPWAQGQRFSQIRYGSQVDLIIPLSRNLDFIPVQKTTSHVEAGVDPVVRIVPRA